MSPFAAGLSEHPEPATAIGEAVGQVLEGLGKGGGADGRPPDLALIFVTPPYAGALADMAATVRSTLGPGALLGCAAVSVVGGDREIEEGPAVSLWAGHTGAVVPFHLRAGDPGGVAGYGESGPPIQGLPDPPVGASAMLLLPDPFSFPADAFLRAADSTLGGLPVVGGLASAGRGPGGNRLVIDDRVVTEGAVGAFLGPGVSVSTVVSQGCRPVGNPYIVTKAESNVVYELAGQPALERLREVAAGLSDDDRRLLSNFVHMGRVIDESKIDFGAGDFLVRNVLGADPENGAMAVGDIVEVGSTAQFQVRDALSADEDLRQMLTGCEAEAALVFTCNGRGTNLFDEADHDARAVSDALGAPPVAGMFCAGELGPVGGRNFLHGFTASLVLLSAARPEGQGGGVRVEVEGGR